MIAFACFFLGIACGIWLSRWVGKLPEGDAGTNPWC